MFYFIPFIIIRTLNISLNHFVSLKLFPEIWHLQLSLFKTNELYKNIVYLFIPKKSKNLNKVNK